MGHGCNYTNPHFKTSVSWVDIDYHIDRSDEWDEYDNHMLWLDAISDVQRIALKLFKGHVKQDDPQNWRVDGMREWFVLTQSNSTRLVASEGQCGELVLAVIPSYPDDEGYEYNVLNANAKRFYESMQAKLYKRLVREGYEVRRATSGWTSEKVTA